MDLLWSEGRVVRVRGHTRTGSGLSLRSSVVGADGLHSTVARQVAARCYREHSPLTVVYYIVATISPPTDSSSRRAPPNE
jgi:2-polyprenyl-6-methoxyphenol hydroxylase-like FAD-dependent oxidoreductase